MLLGHIIISTGLGEGGGGGGGATAPRPPSSNEAIKDFFMQYIIICQPQHQVSIIWETNVDMLPDPHRE